MKKSPEINPTSSVAKVASHAGVFRGVRFHPPLWGGMKDELS